MTEARRGPSPDGDGTLPAQVVASFKDFLLIYCECGSRYLIYRPSALGNPGDHDPDKWYHQRLPLGLGIRPGEAFDQPEQAMMAASRHAGRSA